MSVARSRPFMVIVVLSLRATERSRLFDVSGTALPGHEPALAEGPVGSGIVLPARTTKRTVHRQETKSHCGKPREIWPAWTVTKWAKRREHPRRGKSDGRPHGFRHRGR